MSTAPQRYAWMGVFTTVALSIAAVTGATPSVAVGPRLPLSFEQRVDCQRRIEEVYWRHRIWPKDNPGPKPPLTEVLPEAVLRARVTAFEQQDALLRSYWNEPITAAAVQAEIDRIVANTHDGEMLREIFAALDNDPTVIAECLARPLLAGRNAQAAFAHDTRIHGPLRARIERELARSREIADFAKISDHYSQRVLTRRLGIAGDEVRDENRSDLGPQAWELLLQEFARKFRIPPADDAMLLQALPLSAPGPLEEDDLAFTVPLILSKDRDRLQIATLSWPKARFESWTGTTAGLAALASAQFENAIAAPRATYKVSSPNSQCTDDTWRSLGGTPPAPRGSHSAVWTGTEMIVWGGYAGYDAGLLNTGGRYVPAVDSWIPCSLNDGSGINVPGIRYAHTAVWTGTEMIVWGGGGYDGARTSTGGRYNPTTDSWAQCSLSTASGENVPSPRAHHTALWTGSEMIVWGGENGAGSGLDTGGRYSPSSDTWATCSLTSGTGTNVPSPRWGHTGVWTGSEMIVWGTGDGRDRTRTGGRYAPATDTWVQCALTSGDGPNSPTGRADHAAVWTGTDMIVWGGIDDRGVLNTGGRYGVVPDKWVACSLTSGTGRNTPEGREWPTGVWTGKEMIVWGGAADCDAGQPCTDVRTGGRYDPATDSWDTCSLTSGWGAPLARDGHTAIWTGGEMIVWGGYAHGHGYRNDGGAYCDTACTASYWYQDLDGDGYGNSKISLLECMPPAGYVPKSGDCDDTNAAVHPGAPEACNALDDDCDGSIDEGLSWSVYYPDRDGDGYGNPFEPTAPLCARPSGYVADGTDCDDTNPEVHPGATEVCNGIDDDCDWAVDEGYTTVWFRDADGDGYGDDATKQDTCTPLAGFVSRCGDCDDTNPAIHPGAPERCNGIDDDCDGLVPIQETGDPDGDGVIGCSDNCPFSANPSQRDDNHDGIGDACSFSSVVTVSNDPSKPADFSTVVQAAQSMLGPGTTISVDPGLGPYVGSVHVARNQNLRIVGLDDGTDRRPVIDGGSEPAIVVMAAASGPVAVENLMLQGSGGIDAQVPVTVAHVGFAMSGGTALHVGAGTSRLTDGNVTGAAVGVQVDAGASLDVSLARLEGATTTAVRTAGTTTLTNVLIDGGHDGVVLTGIAAQLTASYVTIARNSGAGIDATAGGTATLGNAILAFSSGGDLVGVPCSNVSLSDVLGTDCSSVNSNLHGDPLLDASYGLQSGSPCLDHGPSPTTFTGEPPTDLAGGPRLRDYDGNGLADADCGAYEMANPALTPGEVTHFHFTNSTTLTWDAVPGAARYDLYRGRLLFLWYGYYGRCRNELDNDLTDTQAIDPSRPVAGEGWFYLVAARDATGHEGTLGYGTSAERSNYSPCQ